MAILAVSAASNKSQQRLVELVESIPKHDQTRNEWRRPRIGFVSPAKSIILGNANPERPGVVQSLRVHTSSNTYESYLPRPLYFMPASWKWIFRKLCSACCLLA